MKKYKYVTRYETNCDCGDVYCGNEDEFNKIPKPLPSHNALDFNNYCECPGCGGAATIRALPKVLEECNTK